MDNLKTLLDAKWPLSTDLSPADTETLTMFRNTFTDGYRAATMYTLAKISTMIAQGYVSNPQMSSNSDDYIARESVKLAKAILKEVNK